MCAYGRVVAEPRISPDGSRVAFVATSQGRGAIVVVPATDGPEAVLTTDPPPRAAASYGGGTFDWAGDDALVYAATDGGLWLQPARGGPPRLVIDPPGPGPAAAPAVSPDGKRVLYTVDARHVAVASLDPDGPWPVRLSTGADFAFDPVWSPDGRLVAWHEWDVPAMPWDDSRIAIRDAAGDDEPVFVGAADGTQFQQPRFAPDGRITFLSDRDGWLNLWTATVDGGEVKPLLAEPCEHGDPSWGQGQRSYAWSPDGSRLAFTRNRHGIVSLCVLDPAAGTAEEVAPGLHGGLSWLGSHLGAVRSRLDLPTEVVVYDAGWSARVLARAPVAGFETVDVRAPELVTWPGDDGEPVHGRLHRPARSATGHEPPPLIMWVHGGPTSHWPVGFTPRLLFFLERGWAVLLPDHRGSTGHGRDYAQALQGRWGDLDVSDVAAGMRVAAERGWGDPRRLVPMGGSAGGFTVLNLLAHHPDLCAAGVDLFGVTDLFDLNETTHRFEAHYEHGLVGPLPDAAELYRDRSPMTVVDRIEAPLLILQGADDVVVPPAQSHAIAERLERLGRPVELHLFEGEGHGWTRPATVVEELGRIESFLRRHVLERRA